MCIRDRSKRTRHACGKFKVSVIDRLDLHSNIPRANFLLRPSVTCHTSNHAFSAFAHIVSRRTSGSYGIGIQFNLYFFHRIILSHFHMFVNEITNLFHKLFRQFTAKGNGFSKPVPSFQFTVFVLV